MNINENAKQEFNFFVALIPLVLMIAAMGTTVVWLGQDPHIPLIFGTASAAVVAMIHGYKWDDIEKMMFKGIRLALPAIVIIMLVGLIIGSWIGGGIVATMIYYGLALISPALFLVTIVLLCAIVSLSIGSSWSTMATVGVAGMGIGLSMEIPAAMIAGAVISGSYFGDKMSPMSDTTNLAAGLTNTDLFVHIKHMFYTTVPGLVIALIAFFILGRQFGGSGATSGEVTSMMEALKENFIISPWLLLVPLAMILGIVIFKMSAIPALIVGIVLGFLCHLFVQGGDLGAAVGALQSGYVIETDNQMINDLFNNGGLQGMMFTVSMTVVAMTFAGILEYSGMLKSIMAQIIKVAKGTFGMVGSTIVAAFTTNATCSEQYISVVVPSRMFLRTYIEKNLHSKNLSRSLEDGGTLTSVFIPWNTCGVYIYGVLGVAAWEYAPFAILNFTVPVIALILAATGIGIEKITDEEKDSFIRKYYSDDTDEEAIDPV
ncbi:Na+/H+ antiporter NhaC [Salinicoccus carnicancri]|uniref:Na+/H+ antiporter NhaC n=1 Tax=Salinicoccus carnicancri TaxID=558170 RepID=UPI00031F1277|nr:Na+/H+ antiporter NhaC [Salinicoccus carnicancri]